MKKVIALISDLDDSLIEDTSTKLVASRGIDPGKFWGETVKELVTDGWDPTLAYLSKIVELSGEGRPLGRLTNADLRAFGATLDTAEFFPGVDGLRAELQAVASKISSEIVVEFYVISGGILPILEGSPVLQRNCNAVYANQFDEDPAKGITRLKRVVTFTEKTRILFEINKGITPAQSAANPYLVNKEASANDRRVAFENMIYMGDGLTDIASFSLVKARGGYTFGLFNPAKAESANRALNEFIAGDRVTAAHAPRFGKDDELGSILRATVATIAKRITSGASTIT